LQPRPRSRLHRTAVRHAGRPAAAGDQCLLEIKLDGYRSARVLRAAGSACSPPEAPWT